MKRDDAGILEPLKEAGSPKTILVAADVADGGNLVKIFSQQYVILEAVNGAETLEMMRTIAGIDLVVLDAVLSEPDGYGVLAQMREDEALSSIPVLFVTSGEDEGRESRALRLGASELVSRPVKPEVLLFRAGNLLRYRDMIRAVQSGGNRLDKLTKLLGRTAFTVEAGERIRLKPANAYVVSCLNIDNFKVINDRFGHDEGDRLLRFVAETRRAEVEGVGGLACRDMADTFFMLMPNDPATVSQITNHFFEQVSRYDLPVSIGVHIGRYVVDDPMMDVNVMIDRALIAMRTIKDSTETRTVSFSDSMRRDVLRQQGFVDDMRPALAGGQFVLTFQPQYDYASGVMTGAEALVRWKHPEKGMISPSEFIPLFEKNGFITQLDLYVWEQACRYLRKWMDEGISPALVSVNISRHDIRSLNLAKVIPKLVEKYHLSPEQLHLEITESAYLDNPQELIQAVKEMQNLGFTVEMDDFGTGYSSLNILKDVPVDALKLDMRFVDDSLNSSRGGRILSSIVRMAQWLKIPVIAEGVETRQQADYLKSIGCSLMQGFYFSKPMPAEPEYQALLQTKQPDEKWPERPGAEGKGEVDFFDASTQTTLLFNSFVGGAVIAEYDGTDLEFLRTNDRYFEVIGYTREECKGMRMNVLTHVDEPSRKLCREALEQAVRTGKETTCEVHTLPMLPGRKETWTLAHIRFLARDAKKCLFYIAVENVTERKAILRETQALTEELSHIISNVPCGIVKWTVRGGEWKTDYVSDGLAEMFGYSRDGLLAQIGLDPLFGVHPDDREGVKKAASDASRVKRDFACQFRHSRKDGRCIRVTAKNRFIQQQDGQSVVYSAVADLSAAAETEAAGQ